MHFYFESFRRSRLELNSLQFGRFIQALFKLNVVLHDFIILCLKLFLLLFLFIFVIKSIDIFLRNNLTAFLVLFRIKLSFIFLKQFLDLFFWNNLLHLLVLLDAKSTFGFIEYFELCLEIQFFTFDKILMHISSIGTWFVFGYFHLFNLDFIG